MTMINFPFQIFCCRASRKVHQSWHFYSGRRFAWIASAQELLRHSNDIRLFFYLEEGKLYNIMTSKESKIRKKEGWMNGDRESRKMKVGHT